MALTSGTLLGPYEILALAGAGGMGEVYKARDTRLDRIVAIKVLPPHFARREDLRLRFEREARIISSLNHPHICTLFDVGVQDGANYLVMEYLEGETLDARLKRGPLSVEEALPLAIQIAEALTEAHRHNLIHRDLKPANVMLTRSGVKLLDFGLAKGLAAKRVAPEEATLTASLSAEGAFMGTLQYMPPEQLEGKDADARSDIFAFGCVLYEMVTGKRAFGGGTQASIITAIMSGEPPSIISLQPRTPKHLELLIRQCIRKKPEERLQSAYDIGLQLEWLSQPVEEQSAPARRTREKWAWAAIAVLAAGLIVAMIARLPPVQKQMPLKVEIQPPERDAAIYDVSVSPSGDALAWSTNRGSGGTLCLRSLSTGATHEIVSGRGVAWGWSPNGRSLLYHTAGKLKRADVAGGGVQDVCEVGEGGLRAAWLQDGTVLLGNSDGPLTRVSASGGAPVPFGQLDPERGESRQRFPLPLPDGRRLLYASTGRNPELSGVYLVSLDGSRKPRRVHPFDGVFQYIHPGRLLIPRNGGIAAVRVDLDGEGGQAAGEPLVIADRVDSFSASQDGAVIALGPGRGTGSTVVLMDRSGNRLAAISPSSAPPAAHSDFSPDGKRIVFDRPQVESDGHIWIYDIARKTTARVTFAGRNGPGAWSATGERIFFASTGRLDKGDGIYEVNSNGTGGEKFLAATDAHHLHASPDGRLLVFERVSEAGGGDLWMLPLTGDRKLKPLLIGQAHTEPRISPDSRLISYGSAETGRREIYIQTLPPGGGKWQVSTNGGNEPKWRADGKEILYMNGASLMSAAIAMRGSGVEVGEVKELFKVPAPGGRTAPYFGASPDGKYFAITHITSYAEPITLLLNWKLPSAH